MLQRLQSVWLLLASVLAFTTLKLSFFSGNILVNTAKEFQRFTAMSNIPLMILTVGVAFASLITIFLFKDRKLQMKINAAILAVSLINIVLAYLQTGNFIVNEWTYDLTSLVYLAIPVLLILALRGIYKDEQLVKSADRLR
jgi:hypothetical protein